MKTLILYQTTRKQMTEWHKGKIFIPNYVVTETETEIIVYYVKFNHTIKKFLSGNEIILKGHIL